MFRLALEIAGKDLQLDAGTALAHRLDAGHPVPRAGVRQVVAVDAGHHGVVQPELTDRLRQQRRLVLVKRLGPAEVDVAEPAGARALVAHHHERRRATLPAFADVRAVCLGAHRVQPGKRAVHFLARGLVQPADLDPLRPAHPRLACGFRFGHPLILPREIRGYSPAL